MLIISVIIITIYFIILIWLSNSIYYYKGPNKELPLNVSIIIAAHNEEKNIMIINMR